MGVKQREILGFGHEGRFEVDHLPPRFYICKDSLFATAPESERWKK